MAIYRVTVKAFHNSTDAQFNVHHYEFPGYVPSETERQEFVDNLADAYETVTIPNTSAVVDFNEIEIRRVDIGDQPSEVLVPDGWPVSGGGTGNSLPPQICAMLRFKAPTAFPRSGRVYLQSYTTAHNNSIGRILAATVSELDAMALLLEEIEVTGQVDAQKVAVTYGGNPRAVVDSNVLFAVGSRNIWQTQRRRTPGVGI